MATGQKAIYHSVAVDTLGNPLPSLTDLAHCAGLSTGIVVTCNLPDATPAAFCANNTDRNHEEAMRTGGNYGKEGAIGQLLCPPPHIDGFGPVVGSWVVNNTACGIGIREDATPITGNLSRFVPHIIVE